MRLFRRLFLSVFCGFLFAPGFGLFFLETEAFAGVGAVRRVITKITASWDAVRAGSSIPKNAVGGIDAKVLVGANSGAHASVPEFVRVRDLDLVHARVLRFTLDAGSAAGKVDPVEASFPELEEFGVRRIDLAYARVMFDTSKREYELDHGARVVFSNSKIGDEPDYRLVKVVSAGAAVGTVYVYYKDP